MITADFDISPARLRSLQERLKKRSAERAYKIAVNAAHEMEAEVVRIIKSEFFWDRAPHRRHPQTTRLVNAFQAQIVGDRGDPNIAARLGIKRGVSHAKIWSLENGSRAHEISGVNGLAFPRADPGEPVNRARNAYGPNDYWTPRPVVHPGGEGHHMMARSREHVLRRIRSGLL